MSVTWLHVSDFHFKSGDPYDRDVVLGALVDSVRRFREEKDLRPDLIFATGDIAQSGLAAEYEAATIFFDALCAAAGVEKSRLFIVPGNHDVDRNAGRWLARTLGSREDADAYFAPNVEKPHLKKQRAYIDWHNRYFDGLRKCPEDSTCGAFEVVDIGGFKIGVLPINSALFCQGEDDHANLWIGRRCLDAALPHMKTQECDLKIALLHHPLDWLHEAERANVRAALQDHVDIILRGHLHDADAETVAGVTGSALHIVAGASYQSRKWPNRAFYCAFEDNAVEITPIGFSDSPRPRWHVDPSLFPDAENYRGVLALPRGKPPGSGKTPAGAASKKSAPERLGNLAPPPPPDFVPRPREYEALKQMLLGAKSDAIGITAALKGAGGYGKTTLAKALAHDADIMAAYPDGVLWAELGEKPDSLLKILSDLVTLLTGEPPELQTINAAAARLGEALGDRRILLVIDDAWREPDLRPFLQGGAHTTRLVTTRIDSVLPENALRQPVDAMQASEALQLLAAGLPAEAAAKESARLEQLAQRLGEWALLLKLVNGFLRNRIVANRQPFVGAIDDVNRRLDAKGLIAFDAGKDEDRVKAVARTIGVSLELLAKEERARFGEIGVFPEDVDIPLDIVAAYWKRTGGLDALDTENLLDKLSNLSLLLALDHGQRTFRLHDTVRHFLLGQAGKDGVVAQQKQLVEALEAIGEIDKAGKATRRYYYLYLPYHLAQAQAREQLDGLLLDPAWLKEKLDAVESMQALVSDYDEYGEGEAQSLVGRTLRLVTGICGRDPRQLATQLACRLNETGAKLFSEAARELIAAPAIVPARATLTPPGAEVARLEGHEIWVTSLCLLPDGRLASGSHDNTIRLWDVAHGGETARFEGHKGSISSLCVLSDGRLASGSHDKTIRLWDVARGVETARLEGHEGWITSLCLLPDGHLASGSHDKTIRLWDVAHGVETARFHQHEESITSLCLLPEGRLASGSDDTTIRLWDVARGVETARFVGHERKITSLCLLPDGRLVSGSNDRTIRLWDVARGVETARFDGHERTITSLCLLPDGRLVSGSNDRTIRLWDVARGVETARFVGHEDWITSLCLLPDGRLASGSDDKTIRLWDIARGAETARFDGHERTITSLCLLPGGPLASGAMDSSIRLWEVAHGVETARFDAGEGLVNSLCLLPDGRLASGSNDGIRLWDVARGVETARLVGHTDWIRSLCLLPDGRLASSSDDKTILLWDVTRGVETARFVGHENWISSLCLLPDGRLASGSYDETIRLWDVARGVETARFDAHESLVNSLCILPDGRLASGSNDGIRLWDVARGVETARFDGHESFVNSLCLLPDGRLASVSDDKTIRLWNVARGVEICRLEVDATVHALVALPDGRLVAGDGLGRMHWLEIRL